MTDLKGQYDDVIEMIGGMEHTLNNKMLHGNVDKEKCRIVLRKITKIKEIIRTLETGGDEVRRLIAEVTEELK